MAMNPDVVEERDAVAGVIPEEESEDEVGFDRENFQPGDIMESQDASGVHSRPPPLNHGQRTSPTLARVSAASSASAPAFPDFVQGRASSSRGERGPPFAVTQPLPSASSTPPGSFSALLGDRIFENFRSFSEVSAAFQALREEVEGLLETSRASQAQLLERNERLQEERASGRKLLLQLKQRIGEVESLVENTAAVQLRQAKELSTSRQRIEELTISVVNSSTGGGVSLPTWTVSEPVQASAPSPQQPLPQRASPATPSIPTPKLVKSRPAAATATPRTAAAEREQERLLLLLDGRVQRLERCLDEVDESTLKSARGQCSSDRKLERLERWQLEHGTRLSEELKALKNLQERDLKGLYEVKLALARNAPWPELVEQLEKHVGEVTSWQWQELQDIKAAQVRQEALVSHHEEELGELVRRYDKKLASLEVAVSEDLERGASESRGLEASNSTLRKDLNELQGASRHALQRLERFERVLGEQEQQHKKQMEQLHDEHRQNATKMIEEGTQRAELKRELQDLIDKRDARVQDGTQRVLKELKAYVETMAATTEATTENSQTALRQDLMNQISVLRQELEASHHERDGRLDDVERHIAEAKGATTDYIQKMQEASAQMESSIESLLGRMEDVETQEEKRQAQVQAMLDAFEELQGELQKAQSAHAKTTGEIEVLRELCGKLGEQSRALEITVTELKADKDSRDSPPAVEPAPDSIESSHCEIPSLQKEVARLADQFLQMQEQFLQLQAQTLHPSELEALRENFEKIARLAGAQAALSDSIDQLRQDVDVCKELPGALAELERGQTSQGKAMRELQESFQKEQGDRQRLGEQLLLCHGTDLEEVKTSTAQRIDELKKELHALSASCAEQEKAQKTLALEEAGTLDETKAKLLELEEVCKTLKDAFQTQAQLQETASKTVQTRLDSVQGQAQSQETASKTLQTRLDSIQSQVQSLERSALDDRQERERVGQVQARTSERLFQLESRSPAPHPGLARAGHAAPDGKLETEVPAASSTCSGPAHEKSSSPWQEDLHRLSSKLEATLMESKQHFEERVKAFEARGGGDEDGASGPDSLARLKKLESKLRTLEKGPSGTGLIAELQGLSESLVDLKHSFSTRLGDLLRRIEDWEVEDLRDQLGSLKDRCANELEELRLSGLQQEANLQHLQAAQSQLGGASTVLSNQLRDIQGRLSSLEAATIGPGPQLLAEPLARATELVARARPRSASPPQSSRSLAARLAALEASGTREAQNQREALNSLETRLKKAQQEASAASEVSLKAADAQLRSMDRDLRALRERVELKEQDLSTLKHSLNHLELTTNERLSGVVSKVTNETRLGVRPFEERLDEQERSVARLRSRLERHADEHSRPVEERLHALERHLGILAQSDGSSGSGSGNSNNNNNSSNNNNAANASDGQDDVAAAHAAPASSSVVATMMSHERPPRELQTTPRRRNFPSVIQRLEALERRHDHDADERRRVDATILAQLEDRSSSHEALRARTEEDRNRLEQMSLNLEHRLFRLESQVQKPSSWLPPKRRERERPRGLEGQSPTQPSQDQSQSQSQSASVNLSPVSSCSTVPADSRNNNKKKETLALCPDERAEIGAAFARGAHGTPGDAASSLERTPEPSFQRSSELNGRQSPEATFRQSSEPIFQPTLGRQTEVVAPLPPPLQIDEAGSPGGGRLLATISDLGPVLAGLHDCRHQVKHSREACEEHLASIVSMLGGLEASGEQSSISISALSAALLAAPPLTSSSYSAAASAAASASAAPVSAAAASLLAASTAPPPPAYSTSSCSSSASPALHAREAAHIIAATAPAELDLWMENRLSQVKQEVETIANQQEVMERRLLDRQEHLQRLFEAWAGGTKEELAALARTLARQARFEAHALLEQSAQAIDDSPRSVDE